jgi:CRP-like cAMP-binding protein
VVQSAGKCYRLRASALKREFALGGELQHVALRYTQALITQMAQTAACNRHHSVDQQLCRWLLLSMDRLPGNELKMTQELIANMPGMRREGVTAAAGHLQTAGLIHYSRGHITILDRAGLEKRVCECYGVVRKEFDRLLPYRGPGRSATAERLQSGP